MSVNRYSGRATFGLLPEPERNAGSFITSAMINGLILALLLYIGATARQVIEQRQYEQTVLIVPPADDPPPPPKVKLQEPPPLPDPPKLPDVKLEAPRIKMPKPEPKPDPKPIIVEAKVNIPTFKSPKPSVVEAPQPKAALTPMPAQVPQTKVSTAPVHLGQTFGVTPNPNATRPATVAAIGNPYGGMNGAAIAPHGVVGGTGIGNQIKGGPSSGVVGKVASAGIPGATNSSTGSIGKVASTGIPAMATAVVVQRVTGIPASTNLEVISKPPVQYTAEAKELKVQGDVILRVTFTANGQVVIQGRRCIAV